MKLLDVLYYNFFLFYTKIIKDSEPHFATIVALGCCQALLLNGTIDIIALKIFCFEISSLIQFLIAILIIGFNYLVFYKTGRAHDIIKKRPSAAGSKILSITISILFFVIPVSWLFWGPIYGKYLLEHCK